MAIKKLSQIKSKDERQFMIEDAARTLKQYFRIKDDKELLKAAKDLLRQEVKETKKALQI